MQILYVCVLFLGDCTVNALGLLQAPGYLDDPLCVRIVLPFLKRRVFSKFQLLHLTTEMNASLFEGPFLEIRLLNFN